MAESVKNVEQVEEAGDEATENQKSYIEVVETVCDVAATHTLKQEATILKFTL